MSHLHSSTLLLSVSVLVVSNKFLYFSLSIWSATQRWSCLCFHHSFSCLLTILFWVSTCLEYQGLFGLMVTVFVVSGACFSRRFERLLSRVVTIWSKSSMTFSLSKFTMSLVSSSILILCSFLYVIFLVVIFPFGTDITHSTAMWSEEWKDS